MSLGRARTGTEVQLGEGRNESPWRGPLHFSASDHTPKGIPAHSGCGPKPMKPQLCPTGHPDRPSTTVVR